MIGANGLQFTVSHSDELRRTRLPLILCVIASILSAVFRMTPGHSFLYFINSLNQKSIIMMPNHDCRQHSKFLLSETFEIKVRGIFNNQPDYTCQLQNHPQG